MSKLETIKTIVAEAELDAEKFFDKGNNSAGTRLRKTLQKLKKACTDLRNEVTENKKASKEQK